METSNQFIDLLKEDLQKNKPNMDVDGIISKLTVLNDNYPFNNLMFLKDIDSINEKLSIYKLSSQIKFLKAITKVLKFNKKEPLNGLYKSYLKLLYKTIREYNKKELDRRKELFNNYPKWDEIVEIKNKLKCPKTANNRGDYIDLLEYLIVSLNVDMLPRKNQDYQKMVINKTDDDLSDELNHLVLKEKKMIFNVYRGHRRGGQQIVPIPANTMKVINKYLKYHPSYDPDCKDIPFIVNYNGKHIKTVNFITRVLNKYFGKGIGADVLRRIFIKSKYGNQVPLELLMLGYHP